VLPVARQKPAPQAVHDADAVALAYVPSGQIVGALEPGGQLEPAGQGVCIVLAVVGDPQK
jgi:hypothetical protein